MSLEMEMESSTLIIHGYDYQATQDQDGVSVVQDDQTRTALKECERLLLRWYRGVLICIGWRNCKNKKLCKCFPQLLIVVLYLCIFFVIFTLQAMVCFQRDILFLNKEVCVTNITIDVDRVCCQHHIFTSFVVPDIIIFISYICGLVIFSDTENDHLSKLAGEVFTTTEEQIPKKLLRTIWCYFVAGILWILSSLALRMSYLWAFKYWDSEVEIYWSNEFQITGSTKQVLIVLSIVGFIFVDLVYTASIINYAIQSELIVYLLNTISKAVENQALDRSYMSINKAEDTIQVLNGKTAIGVSLVIFKLSLSAITAFQQLDQLTDGKALLGSNGLVFAVFVASFNALVWTAMIVFAFVQASRVTGAGLTLKRAGVRRRTCLSKAIPIQSHRKEGHMSSVAPPGLEDLNSLILYTQAVELRAKLFGVPVVPWVMHATVAVLCFVLIMMTRIDLYNPYPYI